MYTLYTYNYTLKCWFNIFSANADWKTPNVSNSIEIPVILEFQQQISLCTTESVTESCRADFLKQNSGAELWSRTLEHSLTTTLGSYTALHCWPIEIVFVKLFRLAFWVKNFDSLFYKCYLLADKTALSIKTGALRVKNKIEFSLFCSFGISIRRLRRTP